MAVQMADSVVTTDGTRSISPPSATNLPAPSTPPDNPQIEDERRQAARYEQWLVQQESAINQQLKYYETEITKLRKQRKVVIHVFFIYHVSSIPCLINICRLLKTVSFFPVEVI